MLIALFVLAAIAVIASSVHVDGDVKAVDPRLTTMLRDSASWLGRPQLVASASDRRAIYVIAPAAAQGNEFEAIRIDTTDGSQMSTRVALGPQSPYRPFLPAFVKADVHGLRFGRPAFHLLALPDGRGPGIHRVDSATGGIAIVYDKGGAARPLLTRTAFNSSSVAEMLSLVSADPDGRWIAALSRTSAGWVLYLFPA